MVAALGILGLLLVAGTGYVTFLGWFGGPVYRLVPASGPAPQRQRGLAILFFSGDTGFNAGMGPKVMQALAGHGVPVLGVNSLTAFAHRRTPAEARAFVATAVERALALPGIDRVVLAGQSFGADMVQYGAAGMPAALRPHVVQVSLAVPGDTLLLKATPGGVFDGAPDAPALPSARRIDWVPVLCVHGAEEAGSLCPLLHRRNMRAVTLPGDHYLHHDAAALADVLWTAIGQASVTSGLRNVQPPSTPAQSAGR